MRRKDSFALALLGGLVLSFFWKLVLTQRILAGVDIFTFFYPYRDYAAHALLTGRLPLWNPDIFLGVPFLADSQTALFYPLHWPLLGLSAPRAVAWSIVIHIFVAACGAYIFARRVGKLSPPAAMATAMVFALSGFLGAQAEHVNQLNTAAWLPWLLIAADRAFAGRRLAVPAGGLLVAVMLLAGHAQAAYINLSALGLFALSRAPVSAWRRPAWWGKTLWPLAQMSLLGAGLAAVQLLPTAELSRLSIRAGGLSYRQAVSFSFDPRLALRGLLPTFGYDAALFSEYVAYVGILALCLACLGWWGCRKHRLRRFALVSTAAGIFLALGVFNPFYFLLYHAVPGFALFRAPARWMLLTTWGISLLAGLGVQWLTSSDVRSPGPVVSRFLLPAGAVVILLSPFLQRPPARVWVLWGIWFGVGLTLLALRKRLGRQPVYALLWVAAIAVELFWARQPLAYMRPTAPEAYSDLRPSIAHLRTAPGLFRMLSLSALTWDPGDLADMRTIWGASLSDQEMYDLVVATKQKEILAPNLPMRYGLQSVDGYGGGVLPLARYSAIQKVLLATASGRSSSEIAVNPDGRLRERLPDVPPVPLLSLLNVKFVIRDKLDDRWVEGVYYDLGLKVSLQQSKQPTLTLTALPDFPATGLGLVSTVISATSLPTGTAVAELTVFGRHGQQHHWTVHVGRETALSGTSAGGLALPVRQGPDGTEYLGLWTWGEALHAQKIVVQALQPGVTFVVRGMSLRDSRTGTFDTVTIHPDFRLTHSGDVKIYENLRVLPRAFLVHKAETEPDAVVVERLEDPRFRPQETAFLSKRPPPVAGQISSPLPVAGADKVVMQSYEPERIDLDVSTAEPAFLMLTDAHYPGWRAWVDGQPVPILRADLLFRAIPVPPGTHHVQFRFQPRSVRWGALISVVTALVMLAWTLRRLWRR
ncbi:MAG: YfhO family protein [Chloroflexi bacterium]|nr:YfhO family protein [Chloroflexota bacterium]